MKLIQQLLFVAFFVNVNVSCAQKIASFKIDPATASIGPNEKGVETTNGKRTIKINLLLSGKAKRDFSYMLTIIPGTESSKPVLINPRVIIKKSDFKAGKLATEVNIKLKELECLPKGEKFKIGYSSIDNKDTGRSDDITITPIASPMPSVCELMEGSTTITPYLKSDKTGDGRRTVELSLVLKGDGKDLPKDIEIQCQLLPVKKPKSDPKLLNDFSITVKRTSFDTNGCPKVIKIPVDLQLSSIDELKSEERIFVLISTNGIVDYKHLHEVILKSPEAKETRNTGPTTKSDLPKGGHSFSHSCISGKNFMLTLLPDSSMGGKIEVKEEKDTIPDTYYYYQFFHTADFAKWLLNIFTTKINRFPCNDCVTCVSYMAERAYEELNALKKQVPATVAGTTKTEEDKLKAIPKDSATAKTEKNESADSAKTGKAVPDTFVYHISSPKDSIFTLSVTKEKDLTILELCKDSKAGEGDCTKERIVDADEKSFNDRVAAMVQKLSGEETIDASKIKPANVYGKYKDDVKAKEPPKEITRAEKEGLAAGKELENEEATSSRVGVIKLMGEKADLYAQGGVFIKKIKIDSIKFSIEEGKLLKNLLFVETEEGTFLNRRAPISVLKLNTKKGFNKLWDYTHERYLLIKDVLRYIPDGGYVPDDVDNIVLNKEKKSQELSAASNLNSMINFSLYTDLTGLLGRRPNGLINTDVTGRFITNTGNYRNKDLTPFSYIEGNITVSKFDSKFKSIDTFDVKTGFNGEKDTVDRMHLMQNAWLKGSMKFNVASVRFFSGQYLRINVGARINIVNADTLFIQRQQRERDVIFFDYFPELSYSINRLKNFGMEMSLKWLFQWVADKEPFANNGLKYVFNPQISFFYFPTSNQSKRVYLRFNYYANKDKDANNFYQLEFGWKTGLKLSK